MKTLNKIYKYALGTLLVLGTAACSEDAMDRVNRDNDHTQSVPSKYILADVVTNLPIAVTNGDFQLYTGIYNEQFVGVDNQFYNAERRTNEVYAASTFNNSWSNAYSNLKNARILLDQAKKDVPENKTMEGIAKVCIALNSAFLTDMFGDIPYSQAALPELKNGKPQYMQPKIDKQEEIYKEGIYKQLDEAVELLKGASPADAVQIGNYDFVYKGNAAKWLKLAYGLKARYLMHTLLKAENRDALLKEVIDCVGKSFQSAKEEAAYPIDNNNFNPFAGVFESREGFAASKSFADKLIERNDPRMHRMFMTGNDNTPEGNGMAVMIKGADDPLLNLAPNGSPEPSKETYNNMVYFFAQQAPTLLLSYHEVLYLKAEAYARLNDKANAEKALKEAVAASMKNCEAAISFTVNAPDVVDMGGVTQTSKPISEEEANAYFDNSVKPRFDANPLKEVMVQKYLAFANPFGECAETYNDIRRLKALGEGDLISLSVKDKFPLRLPYANGTTAANAEVNKAYGNGQYVFSDNVWWAGGSR